MKRRIEKKEFKKKKEFRKQNSLRYVLCAVGMIVLIVAALFLPQIIFEVQDRYRMTNTETQVRNSLDITQLNMTYEQDLNARIEHYLNMKSRIATAIDYEYTIDSEVAEIAESIFKSEWFMPLMYDGYISNYVYTINYKEALEFIVNDCKKYLIHSADYQDGVALMMWYFEFDLVPADSKIRLLVDTESNTVYYMKITTTEDYSAYKKNLNEKLYYLMDVMQSYYEFYYNYYEADEGVSLYEADKSDEQSWFMDTEVLADEGRLTDVEVLEDEGRMKFYLPYGEVSAEFLLQVEYKDGTYVDITMGLPSIGEKIPEMIQD